MIDIHSHLLPGIDDGAARMDQSLVLARHAVANGITHMVITPHIQPGTYDNSRSTIAAAFDLFVVALQEHNIPLHVAMAAEVRLCPEVLPMLMDGTLPLYVGLNGNRTMLLELPHSHIPPGTEQLIGWLQGKGVAVLIAHPERNKEMMHNCDKVCPFIEMGCMLQLTAASVAGRFGETSRAAAEYMLRQGWVSLLATDAHNLNFRPPQLSEGLQAASAIIGEKEARALVYDNPWSLVGGMFDHG